MKVDFAAAKHKEPAHQSTIKGSKSIRDREKGVVGDEDEPFVEDDEVKNLAKIVVPPVDESKLSFSFPMAQKLPANVLASPSTKMTVRAQ